MNDLKRGARGLVHASCPFLFNCIKSDKTFCTPTKGRGNPAFNIQKKDGIHRKNLQNKSL